VPDPIIAAVIGTDPEEAAVLADSIGLALLVVLDTLTPGERVAFVLHDVFAVPFGDIAPLLDRSIEATRQLASRARQQIQRAESTPEVDPVRQREIVDAFFAASLDGDFDTLVGVLHPDVVLRSDGGSGARRLIRGATSVSRRAAFFADPKLLLQAVLVNGSPGVVVRTPTGLPVAIMGFTISGGKIGSIEAIADPNRLPGLNLPDFADS
jgi:RNA polymerase sigma-70 factor (ECF subfamily)